MTPPPVRPRRRTGLFVILLAVLVAGSAAVFLFTRDSTVSGSAQAAPASTTRPRWTPASTPPPPPPGDMLVVAQNYVNAANARDVAAATALVCPGAPATAEAGILYPDEPNTTLSLGPVTEHKDTSGQIETIIHADFGDWTFPMILHVSYKTNAWCVF